jgi:hypothetical protein
VTRWQFDLDQIRKNWERATDLPPDEMPAKFAAVEPPRDPYQAARELLARVRVLASEEIQRHGRALTPFFDQVEELIRRQEATADAKAKAEIRVDLDKALGDLEDLLALFGGLRR